MVLLDQRTHYDVFHSGFPSFFFFSVEFGSFTTLSNFLDDVVGQQRERSDEEDGPDC